MEFVDIVFGVVVEEERGEEYLEVGVEVVDLDFSSVHPDDGLYCG